MGRDDRYLALPGMTPDALARLHRATAVVIGAGGVGGPVIAYLAAAGVGSLRIVDDDRVDVTNLPRQLLYGTGDVGRRKAVVAARRARHFNPGIATRAVPTRLDATSAGPILAGADVVIDASDNPRTRLTVNAAAAERGIPLVWAAIGEYAGRCSVVLPGQGPCYECLTGPAQEPGPVAPGVFPPVCGVVGALAAGQAMTILTGAGDPLVGRLAQVDLRTGDLGWVPLRPDPRCPTCCRYRVGASGP